MWIQYNNNIYAGLQKYADFNTRSSRMEYWSFFAFALILSLFTNSVDHYLTVPAVGYPVFGIVVFLGLIVPGVAVSARRMHDLDKSGWLLLIGLIPLVGLVLFYWFVQPGTPGENQFGPAPTPITGPMKPRFG